MNAPILKNALRSITKSIFGRYYSKKAYINNENRENVAPNLDLTNHLNKQEIQFLNKILKWLSPPLKDIILFKYPMYSGLPDSFLVFIQTEKDLYDKEASETRSLRLRANHKATFLLNVTGFLQDYIQLSLLETLELVDNLVSLKKKETKKRKTKPSIPSEDESLSNEDTLSNDETISSFDEEKVSSNKKKRSSKGQKKPKTSKRSKKSKNLD